MPGSVVVFLPPPPPAPALEHLGHHELLKVSLTFQVSCPSPPPLAVDYGEALGPPLCFPPFLTLERKRKVGLGVCIPDGKSERGQVPRQASGRAGHPERPAGGPGFSQVPRGCDAWAFLETQPEGGEREGKGGPGIRLPGFPLPACWSVSAQYLCDLGPASQLRTTCFLTCISLVLRMNDVAAFQHLNSVWQVVSP